MSQDLVLAKLDTAKIALIEARNIRDAKKVADIASAMKVYSLRQKLGEEVSAHAHAILAEAMKRIGEMLKETDRNGGGRPSKTSSKKVPVSNTPQTLAKIGLSKKESSMAQKIAAMPARDFAAYRDGPPKKKPNGANHFETLLTRLGTTGEGSCGRRSALISDARAVPGFDKLFDAWNDASEEARKRFWEALKIAKRRHSSTIELGDLAIERLYAERATVRSAPGAKARAARCCLGSCRPAVLHRRSQLSTVHREQSRPA
jgi:hypothetical protein